MANVLEHFWFLNYSIEVKNFLIKNLYLSAYPKDKNVSVYYSTPSRIFAKYIVPVINGGNITPMVTFNLQTAIPSPNQTPGGYFRKYTKSKDSVYKWELIRHPIPYELSYRTTMWTMKQSDMDILLYQAAVAAPNNRKYPIYVDGQWGEIETKNFTLETNLEPGDIQDATVRYGFDIVIPRAYLPLNYEEYYGTIKTVDMLYDI